MSIIDTLITDRTDADQRKAKQLSAKGWDKMTAAEREFYLSAQNKGTYKALDLNRVGAAVDYLASRLDEAGIAADVAPKTDWQDADAPTPVQLAQYLANVAALRAAITQLPATPGTPVDMDGLTIEEANSIEQIMLDLDDALNRLQLSFWRCGEIYCGEG